MDIFAPLSRTLNVDPRTGKFIGGGFLAIAVAIYLTSFLKDADAANSDPWSVAIYLLGFAVVVVVLSGLPSGARMFLAWLLTLLFGIYLVAVFLQVLSGDRMPWARATCLLSFGRDPGCQVVGATGPDPSEGQVTVATVGAEPPAVAAPVPAPDLRASATVFVQFAGFVREDVIKLASGLVAGGWRVEGADRGGQRLGAAAGVNEVRFFNAADEAAAVSLAKDVAAGLKRDIAVQNLSASKLAEGVPTGHLEVWISK